MGELEHVGALLERAPAPPSPTVAGGTFQPDRPPEIRGSLAPIPGRCGSRLQRYDPVRYCQNYPRRGAKRCKLHGANTPHVAAAADRAVAEQRAIARVGAVAPIDAADALEDAIARLNAGVLAHAEVAADGDVQAETYRRWLVDLGRLAKDVHAAGLDERRVRISEATVARLGAAVDGAFADVGPSMPDELRASFRQALGRRLRGLAGGSG